PAGKPAGLNVSNLGASLMFNFPERDAHRSGLQDAPVNEVCQGRNHALFFAPLPTAARASGEPGWSIQTKESCWRDYAAGARCPAAPTPARVSPWIHCPQKDRKSLQSATRGPREYTAAE